MVRLQTGSARERAGAEEASQRMTAPSKLIFRGWKKPEIAYELHGWRPEKSLAFVFDDKGQPQVLKFVLPAQFNEHDRPIPAFAQCSPTEVAEIRLVPPPCCSDRAEAHGLRVRARENANVPGSVSGIQNWDSAWELVRLRYDDEILTLEPQDDPALRKLLEEFKEDKRREYASRKQEIHELLNLISRRLPTIGRGRYYAHLAWMTHGANEYLLDQERIKLDIDFGQGGYHHGFLKWTLAAAQRHHHIRNPYLQSKWAKENGLDLQQLAVERKQIASWTGIADSGDPVSKLFKETLGDDFERFGFPTAPSPATLELANANDLKFGASIRFRVTFKNRIQAWLTDCHRRDPHQSERTEFGSAKAEERLLSVSHGVGKPRGRQRPPKPVARFENDFIFALIPQTDGPEKEWPIGDQLRTMIQEIIKAGGRLSGPILIERMKKSLGPANPNIRPDKLLRSRAAVASHKAGLLGKSERKGRIVVYWAKPRAE